MNNRTYTRYIRFIYSNIIIITIHCVLNLPSGVSILFGGGGKGLKYFWKSVVSVLSIIHFYIKILDNVLLRTIYLGVLVHTSQISCQLCNLVCFGAHFR